MRSPIACVPFPRVVSITKYSCIKLATFFNYVHHDNFSEGPRLWYQYTVAVFMIYKRRPFQFAADTYRILDHTPISKMIVYFVPVGREEPLIRVIFFIIFALPK